MPPVTILGPSQPGGVYVLRVTAAEPLMVRFGRFAGGRAVELPAGDYLYVGSARGKRGSATLARRTLRHATRSGNKPPHGLRLLLLRALMDVELADSRMARPQAKRLRWHIDYLLDEFGVELCAVLLIGGDAVSEERLAARLAADPATFVPAPGLGASDHPGATHLFGLALSPQSERDDWWARFVEWVEEGRFGFVGRRLRPDIPA
ncbi:MAG: DUF123 domain-containing protein [Caldilineaceae bacterium]|nr:DUF123 domain-containing protein [Caldilineaceae bacterium]